MQPKHHYQRDLPHIVPPGALLFITFRLANTLPAESIAAFQQQRALAYAHSGNQSHAPDQRATSVQQLHKQLFAKFDALLDNNPLRVDWLRQPAVGELMVAELLRLCEQDVAVECFCVMPNHVHLLVQLPDSETFVFARMMQSLKGRTAVAVNRLLGRTGQPFWQHESYDHMVRDGREKERVKAYILHNPVKAGLVQEWQQWPYSYLAE